MPSSFLLSALVDSVTVACCSILGRKSGRSMQRLHSGSLLRITPSLCVFPAKLRYAGGIKGACDGREALAEVGRGRHVAKAKANSVLFPEDDFAACPAHSQTIHPSLAVNAKDARVTANHVTWLFEASPAQGASIVFLSKVAFLMSAV